MKINTLAAVFIAGLLFSCSGNKEAAENNGEPSAQPQMASVSVLSRDQITFFGDSIGLEDAKPAADVVEATLNAGGKANNVRVYGEIESSCLEKGCWMKVKTAEGKSMHVMFKDYGFFVPTKDLKGKKVIFEGEAFTDTTTVEDLKHFAVDGKKSQAEIDKITQPEVAVSFTAHGVALEN